jgi:membrane protease YdiL (CAAX protease family)
MVVRVPLVLILGMSYEKTAVIYLLVLFAPLVRGLSLGSLGFKGNRILRSLLIGVAYYVLYALAMFGTFFISVYALSGQLVVLNYDPIPALIVFPFMTFCVGVSEEGLFRGFMQTRLEKIFSERRALLIQAVLFGLWHFVWHISPLNYLGMFTHVLTTFIFGLIFGQFYRISRSLAPLILAHGLVDAVGYGAVFNPEVAEASLLMMGSQALSFAVGMLVLALSTKSLANYAHR